MLDCRAGVWLNRIIYACGDCVRHIGSGNLRYATAHGAGSPFFK